MHRASGEPKTGVRLEVTFKAAGAARTILLSSRSTMLDAIHDSLGIVNHTHSELAQLEIETKPEDVLAEIQRLHDHVLRQQAGATLGASRS
jgi:hypothetical protein